MAWMPAYIAVRNLLGTISMENIRKFTITSIISNFIKTLTSVMDQQETKNTDITYSDRG
jgi:hypothetical protein